MENKDFYKNLTSERIGQKLKHFRKQSKLTLEEVGKQVGKTGSTISLYESGKRNPDPDTMVRLCKVYNVHNVGVFFGELNLPAEPNISQEELHFIAMYREMTKEQQKSLLVLMKGITFGKT